MEFLSRLYHVQQDHVITQVQYVYRLTLAAFGILHFFRFDGELQWYPADFTEYGPDIISAGVDIDNTVDAAGVNLPDAHAWHFVEYEHQRHDFFAALFGNVVWAFTAGTFPVLPYRLGGSFVGSVASGRVDKSAGIASVTLANEPLSPAIELIILRGPLLFIFNRY